MTASDTIVKLAGVSKSYRQGALEVRALDHVDFEIRGGVFCGTRRPSGSGKTTLLNLIGSLDLPSEGRLWVEGVETDRLGKRELAELRLRKIGFVFQEYNLIPVLSALENVEFVMLLQGVPQAQRRARASALLADAWARRPASAAALRQQQRIAVARAIAAEPIIVLPDEPTANLDSKAGAALMDMTKMLNEKHGVNFVCSTHDPMVVERARRVIRLRDGRVEADEREVA